MKKLLRAAMALCVLLTLAGCGKNQSGLNDPVTFYYVRTELPFGTGESVIAPEIRESSGHRENLSYLLALYQLGPVTEELSSPLPKNVHVRSVELSGERIELTLGDPGAAMTDARFTLACACLTLTCLDLTEAQSVTVTCGGRTGTMTRDSLIFLDDITTQTSEETA